MVNCFSHLINIELTIVIIFLDLKSILYPELRQSNSTIEETILKSEINDSNQQIKNISPTIKSQKSHSSQNPKSKNF